MILMEGIFTDKDLKECALLEDNIFDYVRTGSLNYHLIEHCFGAENLLPDDIIALENEILQESDYPTLGTHNPYADEGDYLMQASLQLSPKETAVMAKDPKKIATAFRALRNKLEEAEDRQKRANAESRGFLATVIYTIKRAMNWILKKFHDIKGYILDSVNNRPEGYSQTFRDLKWIHNKEAERLATKFNNF